LPTAAQATAYARTYGAANSLNQVTSQTQGGSTLTPTYDLNGNMTSDGVTSYSWTHGNRMSGATRSGMTATYAYDADNRRTRKTVNGVTTRMLWSGADELGEYDGTGTLIRRFVPTGTTDAERNPVMDDRLAAVDAAGTVTWFHTDHQGSVLATSNAAGQTVATANYSPYGEFGDGVTSVPVGSDFGYTGRQYDPETGLYQYRARYYSPRLGVFLSTDPIGTRDDPNLYLYVGLDPVNATDPTGENRLIRLGINVVRRTVRHRGNVGRAIREEGASIAADVATIVGPDSTPLERAEAAFNLASPVRTDEVAAAGRAIRRGGDSFAAREGRRAHQVYSDRARAEGLLTEGDARLPSGRVPDAIDPENRTVRELKLDNPRAVRTGERQVEAYRQELEETTGESWTGVVDTYRPRQPDN
jgi:RHS repeat-associated core domain